MVTCCSETDTKREMNDSGCVHDASVLKLAHAEQGFSAELLDLSDDVLLYILRHCTPRDLKALSFTCLRLYRLIRDRSLWNQVDARTHPISIERLRWMVNYGLSENTEVLLLSGFARENKGCHGPGSCTRKEVEAKKQSEKIKEQVEKNQNKDEQKGSTSGSEGDKSSNGQMRYLGPHHARLHINSRSVPSSLDTDDVPEFLRNMLAERFPEPPVSDGSCPGPVFTVDNALLRHLAHQCPNLTSLSLDYCNIDCKTTSLKQFPKLLKKLSMRGSRCFNMVKEDRPLLFQIQQYIPGIEWLDLSECDWLEPAFLMPLSKCVELKTLHLQNCRRLCEFVAYASLIARYGFKKLEVLDLRGTPVADSEVSAFGWLPELKELYLSPEDRERERHSEHTHYKDDVREEGDELDEWEKELADYFTKELDDSDPNIADDTGPSEVKTPRDVIIMDIGLLPGTQHYSRQGGGDGPSPPVPGPSKRRSDAKEDEGPSPKKSRNEKSTDNYKKTEDNENEGGDNSKGYYNYVIVNPKRTARNNENGADSETNSTKEGAGTSQSGLSSPISIQSFHGSPIDSSSSSDSCDVKNNESIVMQNANNSQNPGPSTFSSIDNLGTSSSSCNNSPGPSSFINDSPGPSSSSNDSPGPSYRNNSPGPSTNSCNSIGPSPNNNSPGPSGIGKKKPSENKDDNPRNLKVKILEHDGSHVKIYSQEYVRVRPGCAHNRPNPNEHANYVCIRRTAGDCNSIVRDVQELINSVRRDAEIRNRNEQNELNNGQPLTASSYQELLNRQLNSNNSHNEPNAENVNENGEVPDESNRRNEEDNVEQPAQNGEQVPQNGHINDENNRQNQPFHQYHYVPLPNQNVPQHRVLFVNVGRRSSAIYNVSLDHRNRNIFHNPRTYEDSSTFVSDYALQRFGTAGGRNLINISRQGIRLGEAGIRPDRSNLRVLSVTGYNNVTNQSLDHLATAAPHLRLVDFSGTAVTREGVERFKALRPDCEVIFDDNEP